MGAHSLNSLGWCEQYHRNQEPSPVEVESFGPSPRILIHISKREYWRQQERFDPEYNHHRHNRTGKSLRF